MPRTELRSRLLEFSLFILLGTVTRGLLAVRKKALDQLKEAKDTLERTVAERTRELTDANNQLSTELTRRRLAEELLEVQNDFRKAIENSVSAGIGAVDLHGRQTYVNPLLHPGRKG